MKKVFFVLAPILYLATVTPAQERQKFDNLSLWTNAAAIASTAADYATQKRAESLGHCEKMAAVRSGDSCRISAGKFLGFNLALIGGSNVAQALAPAKYKKFFESIRLIHSGGHGFAAAWNLRL